MTHEFPFTGQRRDPPPKIPDDPILDEGVIHTVKYFKPEGSGWSDVISLEKDKKQKAIKNWNQSPMVINDGSDWRKKLKEMGEKARDF